MKLQEDLNYTPIQAFAPNNSGVLQNTVTPLNNVAVKLGADVKITINGVTLSYNSGEGLVLVGGVSYTFSVSTPVHIMGKLQ